MEKKLWEVIANQCAPVLADVKPSNLLILTSEEEEVFLQMENDYTSSVSWKDYAASNDRKTLMLLFEKGIPNMTAARYKKNENFFVKLFSYQ